MKSGAAHAVTPVGGEIVTRPETESRDRIAATPIEYGLLIAGLSVAILTAISVFAGPPGDSVDAAHTRLTPTDEAGGTSARKTLQ